MLQLHVARHAESRVPTILKVCCNGSAQQALEVGTEPGEWCTLHVPLTVEHAVVEVQLAVETPAPIERADAQSDAGVLVSEVALLDHDSPLLRRPLGAPPPHAARVAAV